MTEVISSIAQIQQLRARYRASGESLALVPTMGALHQGHLKLVEHAMHHASRVVVSIFVNPLQFGPNEDLARYPHDLDGDLIKLASLDPAAVFAPSVEEMYPSGSMTTRVSVQGMSQVLCGRTRPTHFDGVTTVVTKLFHMINPDIAVFGEKDWQQLAIIRRMVNDLNMAVRIVGVPTAREASGLALSSRNQYLSERERQVAPEIQRALRRAETLFTRGEREAHVLRQEVLYHLKLSGLAPEYVELVHPNTLEPIPDKLTENTLLAVAVPLGRARLIDNILLRQDLE